MTYFEKVSKAAEFLKEKLGDLAPRIGIVLGSGLGAVADAVTDQVIVPYIDICLLYTSRPVHPRPDRLLPLVPLRNVIALQIIPTRQPQKIRVHRRHFLHQVNPVSVRPPKIRRRKQ